MGLTARKEHVSSVVVCMAGNMVDMFVALLDFLLLVFVALLLVDDRIGLEIVVDIDNSSCCLG
jgi:hypothetical protein